METGLTFGQRVAKARGRMSQVTLAEHAGVSESTIKRIEKRGAKNAIERKGLALILVEEAGAPLDLFEEELRGFAPSEPGVEELRQDFAELVEALAGAERGGAVAQLAERWKPRLLRPADKQSEGRGR